jgi:hypothetical protein
MAEKHLAAAIARRFRKMSREERIAKVRKLAASSVEDERFVRRTFPALFLEAVRRVPQVPV